MIRTPECSGRTFLCNQVLNDKCKVVAHNSGEPSGQIIVRETYEVFDCEDERFESDLAMELNKSALLSLEFVAMQMAGMTEEEQDAFRLDDCLGGRSPTINIRGIRALYGDKAPEFIQALKDHPKAAVPIVLKRLKMQEEENEKALLECKAYWKQRDEKLQIKRVDKEIAKFKKSDIKTYRSKTLNSEIKNTLPKDEENSNNDETGNSNNDETGNYLALVYRNREETLKIARDLMLYCVNEKQGIKKDDRKKIKELLKTFVPNLFTSPDKVPIANTNHENGTPDFMDADNHTVFYVNNCWYLFFRLHHIFCERIVRISEVASLMEEANEIEIEEESITAVNIGLRNPRKEKFKFDFHTFVELMKSRLDRSTSTGRYDDLLTEMLGSRANLAYTLDTLLENAVHQLQISLSHDVCKRMFIEHEQQQLSGQEVLGVSSNSDEEPSGEDKMTYQEKAEKAFEKGMCVKVVINKEEGIMTMELLKRKPKSPKEDKSDSCTQEDSINSSENYPEVVENEPDLDDVQSETKVQEQLPLSPRTTRSYETRRRKAEFEDMAYMNMPELDVQENQNSIESYDCEENQPTPQPQFSATNKICGWFSFL